MINPVNDKQPRFRAFRSGGWGSDAWRSSVSYRYIRSSDDGIYFLGFRVVRSKR